MLAYLLYGEKSRSLGCKPKKIGDFKHPRFYPIKQVGVKKPKLGAFSFSNSQAHLRLLFVI